MKKLRSIYTFILGLFIIFWCCSCGKVVQQTTTEKDTLPFFTLSYLISDVTPITSQEPLPPSDRSALDNMLPQKAVPLSTMKFSDGLTMAVHGYKGTQMKRLAYGSAVVTTANIVATPSQLSSPTSSAMAYTSKVYDAANLPVKHPKQSQYTASFNELVGTWVCETPGIDATYDYYLATAFTTPHSYRLAIFSEERVSENLSVKLDNITLYDTYTALIFIQSFRQTAFSSAHFDAIFSVFSPHLLRSLQLSMPLLQSKELFSKKTTIATSDPLIDIFVEMIDRFLQDPKDARNFLIYSTETLLTEKQQKSIIDALHAYSLK